MKTVLQQEILIMTGTSFSSRQCLQKKEGNSNVYSENEQIQEACWNGLLPSMLPEILEKPAADKKLYMWRIKENRSCVEIDLAEAPCDMEKVYSIDPYAFMEVQLMN